MALVTLEECFPSWEEIMGSYVAGSIGPVYVPDAKALRHKYQVFPFRTPLI